MNITLDKDTLLAPLMQVIGVVDRKQTLPILSNVHVCLKDNILSVTGTDLEVELLGQSHLTHTTSDHAITLPGKKLIDICKSLPENAAIELFLDNQRITLKSGKSRFTLSTLPANQFPTISLGEATDHIQIKQSDLKQVLQMTIFAMAQQDVRHYLNGMLLEFKDNMLNAVATDGHRLAFNTIPLNTPASGTKQIIVPKKGIIELLRLVNDTDDLADLSFSDNHLKVTLGKTRFTTKLVDGHFPDYQRVIPSTSKQTKTLVIDRDTLKQVLQRAAILCNEKFKGIRLELSQDRIKVLANNPEQETSEDEISVNYSGEALELGFNVTYLLDVLNVLEPGPVQIKLSGGASNSVVITQEACRGIFVVMPMRL